MNCQEFWNGEPYSPDHLKECPNCAARAERHSRLAMGLKTLGEQMRRVEAPGRVERRLVAAFRAQGELTPMPPRAAWLAVGAWTAGLAATAALALFLVGGHQPQRTQRHARSMTQLAAVEVPADVAGMAGQDEDSGDFLRLPNTEELAPNEAMNLIRVEIPRSAMIALGFSVSEDRASESVEADVMLGGDGVARAIRFLEY
jgi:hypothetical protein